ncbi:MAG TPA: peptidylprolyl isomerase [Thermoanaerobaculia bacterium]|jgi:hypothetical protein
MHRRTFLFVTSAAALMLAACGPSPEPAPEPRAVRLEFREQRDTLTDAEKVADEEYSRAQYAAAQRARREAEPGSFALRATSSGYAGRGGVRERKFADEVPEDLRDLLFTTLSAGQLSDAREVQTAVTTGEPPVLMGYSVIQLLDRQVAKRELHTPVTATVQHLLVSYAGAAEAAEGVRRSKEEARRLAVALLQRATDGESLDSLIAAHSDDASKLHNAGRFEDQVIGESDQSRNAFVSDFNAAVTAARVGQVIGPVETAFGYHLIRVEERTDNIDRTQEEPWVSYAELFFPARLPGAWRDTGLTGEFVDDARAEAAPASDGQYQVVVSFNPAGAKLFRDITARSIGKALGIFLDGYLLSAPVVQDRIDSGEAVLSGAFSAEDAAALARQIVERL